MNLDDLTIGQAKQLAALFGQVTQPLQVGLFHELLGQRVIIRTYSAGCWFGVLEQKAGNEVILRNARRMYRWWAAESISLSAVAVHGIKEDKSKIIEPVPSVWLEAIEIIPCSKKAADQLEGAAHVNAE